MLLSNSTIHKSDITGCNFSLSIVSTLFENPLKWNKINKTYSSLFHDFINFTHTHKKIRKISFSCFNKKKNQTINVNRKFTKTKTKINSVNLIKL